MPAASMRISCLSPRARVWSSQANHDSHRQLKMPPAGPTPMANMSAIALVDHAGEQTYVEFVMSTVPSSTLAEMTWRLPPIQNHDVPASSSCTIAATAGFVEYR